MNDNDILMYCFTDSKGNFCDKIVKNKTRNMSESMIDYLYDRYHDSKFCSINELVWRIRLNIESKPKCPICGNCLTYLRSGKYTKYCSKSCTAKSNIMKLEQKFEVRSSLCLPPVREKTKETLLAKYGVTNISQNASIKLKKEQSFLSHFGYKNNFCNDSILSKAMTASHTIESNNKRKNTNRLRHNVDFYTETFKGRHLTLDHKNKISKYMKSEIGQKVRYDALSAHQTWNTSSYEESTYKELMKHYEHDDVVRQYKCDKYPYHCDFFIKSKNIFIEVQCSHFHHFHPFDKNDMNDIIELERLKEQTKPQYKQIIDTWTVYDVKKRNTAKESNLIYYEIWPNDNIVNVIKNIYEENR